MHLRPARAADEAAIQLVHERSVRVIAAEAYRPAVVEAWVGDDDDTDGETAAEHEADAEWETDGEWKTDGEHGTDTEEDETEDEAEREDGQPANGHRIVAEATPGREESVPAQLRSVAFHEDEAVVGFGDVRFDPPEYLSEPADGGVRAVYVDPAAARQGVGAAILEHLESVAREEGLDSLGLLASINARGFYERHGYQVLDARTFEFGGEVEGPAVEMRMEL